MDTLSLDRLYDNCRDFALLFLSIVQQCTSSRRDERVFSGRYLGKERGMQLLHNPGTICFKA